LARVGAGPCHCTARHCVRARNVFSRVDSIAGALLIGSRPRSWQAIQDLNLKLEDLATTTPETDDGSFPVRFFAALKDRLLAWFADAANGIKEFFAERVHTQEFCTTRSDGTEVCASGDQLVAILAGTSASTPATGGGSGAPASISARRETGADTATTTTSSGNDQPPAPVQ
jgi:hypothetical protein